MTKHYDHIIVGTGQATSILLGKLTQQKGTIAVIEGNQVGGSCVNYGCTPTKALVASAKAIHMARSGSKYGFSANPVIDFPAIMARMNEIRTASNESLTEYLHTTENVTLYRAWAHFIDNHTLQVGDSKIQGSKIYLNVGTRPIVPSLDGLEDISWIDSSSILELSELPSHLLVLGGGYIGLEFAQIFKRLGTSVTVVSQSGQLMPKEDEDIAQSVQSALEDENIKFFLNAQAVFVQNGDDGIHLTINQNGIETILEGSHLLVATGRQPNTDKLRLDNTDIQTNEKGYIQVDDHIETSVPGIFAPGDVNGEGAFTHTSVNDGEIILDHLFNGTRKLSERVMTYALFTDPPLGRVGLSERAALQKGHKIRRGIMPMDKISRAKEMGETRGMAKLIVDVDTDLILGAAIHGPGADEIINMFAAIIHSGIPCMEYRKAVLVHPTVSELMPFILDSLEEVQGE